MNEDEDKDENEEEQDALSRLFKATPKEQSRNSQNHSRLGGFGH
jgi:hypothetical protein